MNNSTLFEKTPVALNGQVSEFKNNVPFLGSMNYGRVYPVYKKLVMPGDRLYLDATSVIRGADPIAPVMGDTFMEYHAFFVPLRILWNHFKQFLGENDTSAWTQNNEYLMPRVVLPIGHMLQDTGDTDPWLVYKPTEGLSYYLDLSTSSVFGANRLADYLGIHPSLKSIVVNNVSFQEAWADETHSRDALYVNALPFRAYWEIWNHAYRNENYMDPVLFSKDDGNQSIYASTRDEDQYSVNNPFGDYITYRGEYVTGGVTNFGGEGAAFVLPASKLKDAFTTVLPEAQKGPQVDLLSIGGRAPVITAATLHDGTDADGQAVHTKVLGNPSSGTVQTLAKAPIMGVNTNLQYANNGASANLAGSGYGIAFDNLYADLSNTASLTINAFRLAATTQQWYELAARAGTRFDETIFANFGVFAPSSQIDVPEYLGGVKFAINSWQVPQTAPNADGSGLGTVGAFTHTSDTGSSLVGKAFTEWGYVMVMAVPRVHHEYATFCDPHFFQEGKFDFYWPLFDHIGEQPIPQKVMNPVMALYNSADGEPWSDTLESVFKPDSSIGFQEAWWFERYSFGNVAGVLNPVNPGALDYWTYVEELESPLNVGPLFMSAYDDAAIVDKTLQLGSEASLHAQQLMVSIMFEERCSRRMSLRSVPGITRI